MASKETVTRVIDGDTFETDSRKESIRLKGVDTPERGESGYEEAKRKLEELILGKEVTVARIVAYDNYGRAVAMVVGDDISVNKAMRPYAKKK